MNDFSHMSHLQTQDCDLVRAGIKSLFDLDEVTSFEKATAARCRETPVEVLRELADAQTITLPSSIAEKQRMVEGPSTLFLETVSASRFLDFAYWDLLERDIDEQGQIAFGGLDFEDIAVRRRVIHGILISQEYASRSNVDKPFDRKRAYHRWRDSLCPRVPSHHTFESKFLDGLGGGLRKKPLIWRDNANRNEIFAAFGMTIHAECRRGFLAVEPEWVFHGPKCKLRQGLYRVKLAMSAEVSDLFHFDIVYEAGTKVVLQRKFFGSQHCVDAVDIPEGVEDFEVRLFNLSGRLVEIEIQELSLSVVE